MMMAALLFAVVGWWRNIKVMAGITCFAMIVALLILVYGARIDQLSHQQETISLQGDSRIVSVYVLDGVPHTVIVNRNGTYIVRGVIQGAKPGDVVSRFNGQVVGKVSILAPTQTRKPGSAPPVPELVPVPKPGRAT